VKLRPGATVQPHAPGEAPQAPAGAAKAPATDAAKSGK
jgi:hypothetical protein